MKMLAHRGFHRSDLEKNGEAAFARAFEHGFGIETDIRDRDGELVVAHDPAGPGALPLTTLLQLHRSSKTQPTLALNIKADGLQPKLVALLAEYAVRDYFLFDMSVPEAVRYLKSGAPVFTRQSEYENAPAFYAQAKGVWLDEFSRAWVNAETILTHRTNGKALCLVSPELHGRDHLARWQDFKKWDHRSLMLCTDFPEQAAEFFGE